MGVGGGAFCMSLQSMHVLLQTLMSAPLELTTVMAPMKYAIIARDGFIVTVMMVSIETEKR